MRQTFLLTGVSLAALAQPLCAQEHAHAGPPPSRLGRVTFPNSCSSAAQQPLDRGLALLHSFWYEEASRSFRDAAAADTSCAIAQWALASSYLHPLWAPPTPTELNEGTTALARARQLGARTHREGMYVEAIAAYYDSAATVPHARRLRHWSDALGRLSTAHPEDGEAAAFFALSLVAVANASPPDTTYALQRRAADILEPLFTRQPTHPGLAHYLIHATDAPPLARSGARAADRYAEIAPSVPHARHMPSHIYVRLGQWDRVVSSNASSAAAARQYEAQQQLPGTWDQTLHAMDYMAYGYLQRGRDRRARAVMDTVAAVSRYVPDRSLAAEYALAAVPARLAMEREQWREAAALEVRTGLQPHAVAVTRFARVIGAARSGDARGARSELVTLIAVDEDVTRRQMGLWVNMVHAQRLAAEAWAVFAEGDTSAAIRLATEAAQLEDLSEKHPVTPGAILPARELLGDLLLVDPAARRRAGRVRRRPGSAAGSREEPAGSLPRFHTDGRSRRRPALRARAPRAARGRRSGAPSGDCDALAIARAAPGGATDAVHGRG